MSELFFSDDPGDRVAQALAGTALARARESEDARYLLVRAGRVLTEPEPLRLAWRPRTAVPEREGDVAVFLGVLDDRPCFALVPAEAPLTADDRYRTGYGIDADGFIGLYQAAMGMAPAEARLAARAVHFGNWINRTRHCGVCGAPMRAVAGGHKRICSACAREEFPRVDPVVIALVVRGSRCLLGRQPKFPPRRYSAVAGFVEPGETLEAAVHREAAEEVGVAIARAHYVDSQPWPFPCSLMVGFLAEAGGDEISLNDRELEDARWFERAEITAATEAERTGGEAAVTLPPAGSLARRLIEHWLVAAPKAGRG